MKDQGTELKITLHKPLLNTLGQSVALPLNINEAALRAFLFYSSELSEIVKWELRQVQPAVGTQSDLNTKKIQLAL